VLNNALEIVEAAHSTAVVPRILAAVACIAFVGGQVEHGHQCEIVRFADSRAAVSRAPNCRCMNPSVGDPAGTCGAADVLGG